MPPVKGARVLSVDPGYRTGCKVAALSDTGKLLAYATIYPTEPKNDIPGSERIITKLIDKFSLNTIVIGNGTASVKPKSLWQIILQRRAEISNIRL